MYREGDDVEKDVKKAVYHMEKAAIGGHHLAGRNLGCIIRTSKDPLNISSFLPTLDMSYQ